MKIIDVYSLIGANAVRADIKERSTKSEAWRKNSKKKYEDESILPFSMGVRLSTSKGLEVAYSCVPESYRNELFGQDELFSQEINELFSQEIIENGKVMNPECDEVFNIFKEKEEEISMKLKINLFINTVNEFIPELNNSINDRHKALKIRKEIQPAITKMLLLLLCESINSQDDQAFIGAMRDSLAYAVIKKEEKFLTAKITLKDGQLHLHCLKDEKPPYKALILPYESVRELVNPTKTMAFLDVGWPGNNGKVYIEVGNTGRGKQFVMLTTGELGPSLSYRNTTMEGMGWKGQPGEWICGGNYDSKGAAPVVEGLTENGEYVKPRIPGLVAGAHVLGSNKNAKFIIYARGQPQQKDGLGFGQVEGEKSLELVRAMAALDNIKDVRIVDCGVVLPLL
ncbi:unnamed protein product [Meganyctiphanes norvegica]|uniref:Uncharacterized protein n=1 Tax=Meganyctiphanes norvegica TaxID=48144 RepID=A0AAV2PUQ4_MEGNR